MQKIVHKLHAIKKAHKKTIKAQRYGFLIELEQVSKKLYQVKLCSIRFEYKINILKNQQQIPEIYLNQDILATQNTLIILFSIKPLKKKNRLTLP